MKQTILILALWGFFLQGCASIPSIHEAAQEGDVAKINKLIKNGDSPDLLDNWGQTPLLYASSKGHLEVVRTLLENGADPNRSGKSGNASLHYACNVEIQKLLLEQGAKVDLKNRKGLTSLHEVMLCLENEDVLAQALIDAGADLNEKELYGLTPLHFAVGYADQRTVALLLERGAEVNEENIQGLTASDMAVVLGKEDIAGILAENGGRSKKYSSKSEAKVQFVKGKYFGNSGIFPLKKAFERDPGFNFIKFKLGWNGTEGSLGLGFTYRGFETVFGRLFAEPGHTYIINAYGGNHPHNAYAEVMDKETGKVVGILR